MCDCAPGSGASFAIGVGVSFSFVGGLIQGTIRTTGNAPMSGSACEVRLSDPGNWPAELDAVAASAGEATVMASSAGLTSTRATCAQMSCLESSAVSSPRWRRMAAPTTESVAGVPVEIVVIQEAGLDGFWVHRLLEANRIKSHVVDAASISVPRRRRRAKTDVIDGETLLRTLRAWKRGEPRVCAMVAPPSPDQEDQRRISRERAILLRERVRHVNRIKGLLSSQGITDFEPLHKDRRIRLDALRTGDGRPLPPRLKAELLREIELIELLLRQIVEVENAYGSGT